MVDGIRRRRLTLAVIYMNIQENSGPDYGPRHRRICSGYGNIPSQTVKYIHYKANRTAMTLGWNSQDEEDLRQDLFLEVFVKMKKWDESRGRSLGSYLQMCVDARIKSALRASRRQKRANVDLSLDVLDHNGDAAVDGVSGNVGLTCLQCDRINDVRTMFASLDDELMTACRCLAMGISDRKLARRLGRSRKYVAANIFPRLRQKFAELRGA